MGVGSLVAPGAWTPLRTEAPADTGPWVLEVRAVSVSGAESEAVAYPHPAGGVFEDPLYVADATRSLKLRFLSGGLVKEELSLPLAGRLFPGHLLAVDGLGAGARAALSEVLLPQEPVRLVSAPPALWPASPLSYGGLSALVVADPGPVLSPAQLKALRAWISSGGRLLVVSPRPGQGSLAAQVGEVPGWGRVLTPQAPGASDWSGLLGLRPYGEERLLGTDFAPPARGLPARGTPEAPAAIALLAGWAGLGSLILVLRRGGLGLPLLWSAAGLAAIVGLWTAGALDWDRGLPVHSRELVLPDDLGRFTSLEAKASLDRSGPFDWPSVSPWALARWREALTAPGAVRKESPEGITLDAFLPALDRRAEYRVRWENGGLRWFQRRGETWANREVAPSDLAPDAPWIAKLAASRPETLWSVGLEGTTCWLRPELLEDRR